MDKELTVKKESLISVVAKNGLGEVLKPLTSEICLLDTHIAGTTYLEDPSPLEKLRIDEQLYLRREESNPVDEHAILVLNDAGKKLGYVPQRDNLILSRLMDGGKLLTARISEIHDYDGYKRINIRIFLLDY